MDQAQAAAPSDVIGTFLDGLLGTAAGLGTFAAQSYAQQEADHISQDTAPPAPVAVMTGAPPASGLYIAIVALAVLAIVSLLER